MLRFGENDKPRKVFDKAIVLMNLIDFHGFTIRESLTTYTMVCDPIAIPQKEITVSNLFKSLLIANNLCIFNGLRVGVIRYIDDRASIIVSRLGIKDT
jgi:hypothetical protein